MNPRVPLTEACLRSSTSRSVSIPSGVFPIADVKSNAIGRVLDTLKIHMAVPHGFWATFRTWAAETTNYQREVCEMALAHTLSSKVEATYNRGNPLEKRRGLMQDWSIFLFSGWPDL